MVVLEPDSVAAVQAKINSTAAMASMFDLTPIEFPIVFRENGDWAQYVDEYNADGTMRAPGVCIIDPDGNFYAANHFMTLAHPGIDWVVRRVDEVLGARQPVDTILALDRSGSMGYPPPSGGSPDMKIDILKDAVGVFLDVWEANAVPGDRVGVVDFNGDLGQYVDPITTDNLVPVPDSVPDVDLYVRGLSHGGITCMGGAVANGLDALEESGRRHIILFSDGMQNCNPVLVEDGPFIQILHVDPADVGAHDFVDYILGDSGIAPKPGIDLEDFDTRIHTIGVGLSGSPWTDLMSEIASETHGLHFETPAPEIDLQNFYLNDLLESFKGATPQLVQHPHGTFGPAEGYAQDRCWINSTARWLTVVLSWQGDPDQNQLLCTLEAPDGTLIEIHSRTKAAPRRRVISMPLPTYHYDRLVNHAGEWRLHIMGRAKESVPYQVFWIVDDWHVHFDVATIDRSYRVGESLLLQATLLQDGEPLSARQIQKAMVRVASPTVDLGEFLDSYKVDPAEWKRAKERGEELELISETELKLYALSQDKEAIAHCTKMSVQSVAMDYEQGKLVNKIEFTQPGMHRFDLYVDALDRKGYHIVRTRTLNVFVK
jgi:hypothetical protein